MNTFDSAIVYYNLSNELSAFNSFYDIQIRCLERLNKCYVAKHDFEKAYFSLSSLDAVKKLDIESALETKVDKIKAQYDVETREAENEFLRQELQRNNLFFSILAIAFALLIISLFFLIYFIRKH
jgi:hypothetical protein